MLSHRQLGCLHEAAGPSCCERPRLPCRPHSGRGLIRVHAKTPFVEEVENSRAGRSVEHVCLNDETDLAHTRQALERLLAVPEVWGTPSPSLLHSLPPVFLVQLDEKPSQKSKNSDRAPDFFANVGDAIRTLREDIPQLFQKDLNYDIYREDIVFRDPRNCFRGMKNYHTIFWSLRFHGRIFFKRLYVDVKRIWQPEDGVIRMRWTVHGIPRVPWEAEGTFDGISTYRLDNSGRIYEHSVDNVLLRDPPMITTPPLLARLNLVPSSQGQTPVPGLIQGGLVQSSVQGLSSTQLRSASQPACQQLEDEASYDGLSRVAELSAACAGAGAGCASVCGAPPATPRAWYVALLRRFSWVRMYTALEGTLQLLQMSGRQSS